MKYYSIFEKQLRKVKKSSGDNYIALCPFHEDRNPSFSFNAETGLWQCFACREKGNVYQFLEKLGYTKEEIKEELGLSEKTKRITYEFRDIQGKLLYKKHRIESNNSKTFFIEWLTEDKKLILYNLSDLKKAGDTIHLVEGEKCCEILKQKTNIPVISYNNFKKELENSNCIDYFKDKKIYVFVDNDEAGEKKAGEVLNTLKNTARQIFFIRFPEKEKGYDIADWISEDKTLEEALERKELVYEKLEEEIILEKLQYEEIPEVETITEFSIPIGKLILIAGLGDTGKTLFSIFLAFKLVELGKNVAFLSLEDGMNDYKNRMKRIYQNNKVRQKGKIKLIFVENENIIEIVKDLFKSDFDFVFIDPIGSLFEDENSNAVVQPILKELNQLTNRYSKTIVLLHHLNKTALQKKDTYNKNELLSSIRGASAITSNSRFIIYLRRKNDDLEFLTLKNNFGKKKDFKIKNLVNVFYTDKPVEVVPLELQNIQKETTEEGLPF